MFVPQIYGVALAMMITSMLCWGSWANTQKAAKGWRFELFYWDYVWGILIVSLVLGLTLGSICAGGRNHFQRRQPAACRRH